MKTAVDEAIPEKQECVLKVKNISDALYVFNGKWKFPLIYTLQAKPLRFNEILQLVEGITPKVLAKELRDLEIHGLIARKVYPTMPVIIVYETTPYSATLKNILYELSIWGEQHRERVKQAFREGYTDPDKN